MRALLTLIRWLGPWAEGQVPQGARVEALLLGGRLKAHLFTPAAGQPIGAWLVVQGLHHQGPADPRFDRFCRVLAQAGFLVLAPFLPDQCALRLSERSADDLATAFDELERRARELRLGKPAVFSISFGSQPAIALAARPSHADRIGSLALFGGFADFPATIRHVMGGQDHDPTNAPVVLLHLLDELDAAVDRQALEAALRRMVERTWGRPELKRPGARDAIAAEVAAPLGPRERELFLHGCLLSNGAADALGRLLEQAAPRFAFADPRPLLPRVRAPILIVHGRDDDVVPWTEALRLRAAIPARHPTETIVSGLYGHTASTTPGLIALTREIWTLFRIVRALARATGRRPPSPG
jgi:pimeloyl-ACP methyl ester carboxylesterase